MASAQLNRAGWTRFEGMDADCGQNVTTRFGSNLEECQRLAESKGYGGFAVWNDIAFFRSASGADLRTRLHATQGFGSPVVFFVFEARDGWQHGATHRADVNRGAHTMQMCVRPSSAPPTDRATEGQGLLNGRASPSPGRVHDVSPLNIRFTHGQIADAFKPRGTEPPQRLDDVIDSILRGESSARGFPPMIVVHYRNKLYSLSNRRLFVFRVLAMHEHLSTVQVQVEQMESVLIQQQAFDQRLGRSASWWDRAFTTSTDGHMVRVRGRGSRFANKQAPRQEARSEDEDDMRDGNATIPRSGRSRARIARAMRRNQNASPEPNYGPQLNFGP